MTNKSVLITGGAGFVGRHFCKRFSNNGWDVTCIDNLISESSKQIDMWPSHLKPNNNFTFINKDCREYFKNEGKNTHFNLIIHLAAVVGGRATIENSPIAIADDLSIDAEMFKWAISSKPDKIIFFSSSAAYPIKYQQNNEFKTILSEDMISFEEDIGMADLTYGWAKLTGEYLARLAHQKHCLNVVCYRPFSGYGEDQDEVYPFPAILSRVLKKENPINIWSNTIRDFIYIEDVIDFVINTMDKISDGSALNIGTGIGTSFKNLAHTICNLTNHIADINILNNKPSGVYYRVSNTDLSKKYYAINNTTLEKGIKLCIKYNNNTT